MKGLSFSVFEVFDLTTIIKNFELHQGREAPCRVILILWIKLKQRSNTGYAPIPAKSWKPTYTIITNFKAWEKMKTLADLSQTKDK